MNITPIIDTEAVEQVTQLFESSRKVVIVCHMTPDGDALGSSLALAAVLSTDNRRANIIVPDTPPKQLSFLPGAQNIIIASRFTAKATTIINNADLIVCLDFNALKRIDRLQPVIEHASATKILIDHHLDPESFAAVTISHPEISSTCALLYLLLYQMGWNDRINETAAECIYTGMLTDTGNFSYNSNDPNLYLIIAQLLAKGIDKDAIYDRVWNTNSANRLRICGYSLYRKMQLFEKSSLALITLNRQELDEFDYIKGDTESLVNKPLSIPGYCWSVFMREDDDGYIKVSMRSKGEFPVNIVCEDLYGGGGHLNAAGGEFYGSMTMCVDKLLTSLHNYAKYLPAASGTNLKTDAGD